MMCMLTFFLYYITCGSLGWAQLMETEMQGWAPIGVVAAIVPWNFPLMLLSWKVRVCKEGVWECETSLHHHTYTMYV